ncbi:hypothetical protein D3C73_1562150 [compost metagenome]
MLSSPVEFTGTASPLFLKYTFPVLLAKSSAWILVVKLFKLSAALTLYRLETIDEDMDMPIPNARAFLILFITCPPFFFL